VSRIDPATNTVVATVPLSQHPSNPAIAPNGLASRPGRPLRDAGRALYDRGS
jgi:hypothetical protein